MPHPTYRRLVGRNFGRRGDVITPDLFNRTEDRFENTPTTTDVTTEIVTTVPPLVSDALANDETLQTAIGDAITDADIPGQVSDAVTTDIAGRSLVEGRDVLDEDIGVVIADDGGNATSFVLKTDGDPHPYLVERWSPLLADAVHGEFGVSRIDETVSGYALVITDEDGRIAWGVEVDGSPSSGTSGGGGTSISTYPSLDWAMWTDSLGSGLNTRLATLTGRDWYNGGVGGQQASHIAARMGAVPSLVTLEDDEIPASGTATITEIIRPPIRWETGEDPGSTLVVAGSLTAADGTVVNGTIQQASGVFTFARTVDGDALPLIPQTRFIPTAGAAHVGRRQLIIAGRNSIYRVPNRQIAQDVGAMLAMHTATVPATILCDVPKSAEDTGPVVALVDEWNEYWLPRVATGQYFPLFELLRSDEAAEIAEITWTSTDEDNITDGITPESFRADALHLNDLGKDVAAHFLYEEMHARGWL